VRARQKRGEAAQSFGQVSISYMWD